MVLRRMVGCSLFDAVSEIPLYVHFTDSCVSSLARSPLVLVLGLRDSELESLIAILETWGTPAEMMPDIITNEAGQGKERIGAF